MYPYVCTYHPGMVGAVVVGHGVPRTVSATTTGSGPVVQVESARQTQPAAASEPVAPIARSSSSFTTGPSWPEILGAVAVLLLLTAGLVAYGRWQRRTIVA